MNQESVQLTYELITNPILRLLVYFLTAAVAGLSTGIVYLFHSRMLAARELMQVNEEMTKAYMLTAEAMKGMKEDLEALSNQITDHLIRK